MSRSNKKGNALRSIVLFVACAAVLAFVLKDYLVPIMEGWEISNLTPEKILNWLLWLIDLRETP